ncbi:TetR/AcrR family transcriptional regulator [Catenulispora sp. NF23]|uniref:TetR/AcrR family transcriptional regulator n=1 Tax=Catenulispora pinistramenti TaxID=2705254 RepID=UPI001BADE5F4|nr:TetR/AcrR family transcriptional regulator [Catenulispora pinistramenti]MBS2535649.1 TetR/AcrR family transcriptional regulator [Catenulispora pinistramenti]
MTTATPGDQPTPDLRADARRNQRRILLAAARVLADDPAASMQRVADEAEVARPTVYRRYPTKEALVEAIGAEAAGEFAAALDQAQAAGDDAAGTLARLIRELARIGADYPIVLQSAHTQDTAELVARVDELITRGQAAGELRADVASDVLRHSLFGALSAGLRLVRDPVRPQRGAEEVGAQIAAIIVEGMRKKGAPA